MSEKLNLKKIYKDKKVFLTGHTGFKGSWLTLLLKELGAEVMGYSLAPLEGKNLFALLELDSDINHVIGDIRDAEKLSNSINQFEPDFVFHLAAQALVRESYEDPHTTFSTNIIGSINVMEAVRFTPSIRSFVCITSDKCYENIEQIWGYKENDQLGGSDPYSSSKAAAEIAFSSYARSYYNKIDHLEAASARAGNVIGGGDWSADRIIPDCIRALESGKPIKLRNPNATRPWQHVLEPLNGYLMLGAALFSRKNTWGGAWNFGPPSSDVRTVEQVAKGLIKKFGRGTIEIEQQENAPHEANLLQLNCDKANQLLGWHPRWNADKTIEATAEWYEFVLKGGNAKDITLEQITKFFSELS